MSDLGPRQVSMVRVQLPTMIVVGIISPHNEGSDETSARVAAQFGRMLNLEPEQIKISTRPLTSVDSLLRGEFVGIAVMPLEV